MNAVRTFPLAAESPRAARRWLAGRLRAWAPDGDHDTALLLISELVSNCVVHARTMCTVALWIDGGRLTVQVKDGSAALPVVVEAQADPLVAGRGMKLVAALATRSGWDEIDDGKVVWFEVPIGLRYLPERRSDGARSIGTV